MHKSLKLWSMYADIEESLGTVDTTKAVYNRMLELRVATPQVCLASNPPGFLGILR